MKALHIMVSLATLIASPGFAHTTETAIFMKRQIVRAQKSVNTLMNVARGNGQGQGAPDEGQGGFDDGFGDDRGHNRHNGDDGYDDGRFDPYDPYQGRGRHRDGRPGPMPGPIPDDRYSDDPWGPQDGYQDYGDDGYGDGVNFEDTNGLFNENDLSAARSLDSAQKHMTLAMDAAERMYRAAEAKQVFEAIGHFGKACGYLGTARVQISTANILAGVKPVGVLKRWDNTFRDAIQAINEAKTSGAVPCKL